VSTPRRSHGREPQAVGEILARYLRTSGIREKLRSPEVYDCWPEVAGAEAGRHSRVVGFSNCVLHVEVDSAPWLHILSSFKKRELLDGLRGVLQGTRVRDIKFRIGARGGWPVEFSERDPCPKHSNPPTTQETSRSSPA